MVKQSGGVDLQISEYVYSCMGRSFSGVWPNAFLITKSKHENHEIAGFFFFRKT